jgi:hypothetical protein
MKRLAIASALALTTAACGSYPSPVERIHTVDSPADVRVCRKLAEVSDVVPTTKGFEAQLELMQNAVVSLGGTHLFLEKRAHDWSLTRGIAYLCPTGVVGTTAVIVAKG